METEYQYFAFISYKREDEKWAKWLQKKLENYKLPAVIRKEKPKLPLFIRPIFRDKTDLKGGGKLINKIKDELHASRHLIVICSPNSVQSDWINEEIQDFIENKRINDIIPFIVKGKPKSPNLREECFPKVLRTLPKEEELLGIDINEAGKEHAFIKLISQMLDIRFDKLWQRHKRQTRIKRIWTNTILSLILLLGILYYDYSRIKYEYFADYVDTYGIPSGIISLNKDVVEHRAKSYRMEYKRIPLGESGFYTWRLQKVVHINSSGTPIPITNMEYNDRSPIQVYIYSNGYLTEVIHQDEFEKKLIRYNLKDDLNRNQACLVDFEKKEKHQGNAYLSMSTSSMSYALANSNTRKSNIKRYAYIRNKKGHIIQVTFHANDSDELEKSAVCDNDGIFGMKNELDTLGRKIKTTYIGINGEKLTNKYGVAQKVYTYDKWGNIASCDYLDIEGKLVNNERKYAREVQECDLYGNIVGGSYYSPSLKVCYDTEDGVAIVKLTYDEHGYLKQTSCYDPDNMPCYNKYGWSTCTDKYNTKGYIIERTFYDINGKRCINTSLHSRIVLDYDKYNRCIHCSAFDCNDMPCFDKESGSHSKSYKYDKNGYCIKEEHFDINNKKYFSPQMGCSKRTFEFDNYGNCIIIKYFDENDNLCFNNELYAITKYNYDHRGNIVEQRTYDPQNKLCITKGGYAIIKYKIDDYGNCIQVSYFDENEKLVNSVYGYASFKSEYNKKGLLTEEKYYSDKDSLCNTLDWYAILKREYDIKGNLLKEVFYDIDTTACYCKNEIYSKGYYEYDKQNNLTKESFYDIDNKLLLISKGYAIAKYKYNIHRQLVEESYYDTNNNPCFREQGYHKCINAYNRHGNLISKTYYDANNHRCKFRGISQTKFEYNDQDLIIKRTEYDEYDRRCVSDAGYSAQTFTYDHYGNIVEFYNLDKNDKTVEAKVEGIGSFICHYKKEYNQKGNLIKVLYYDENENLSVRNGWAVEERAYNDKGLLIQKSYYDENYKLLGGPFNKPIEKYKYNKYNQESLLQLYNSDSTLYINAQMKYDKDKIVEIKYTDTNDKPKIISIMGINSSIPYAKAKFTFDQKGNIIKSQYFDEKDSLFNGKIGYAYIIDQYDSKGRFIQQELFDKNGNYAESNVAKWSIAKNNYDAYGNLIEQSYYDKKGNLAETPWGWARRLQTFNKKGQCINDIYYRFKDGKQTIEKYDSNGRIKDESQKEVTDINKATTILLCVETYGQMYEQGFRNNYLIIEWNSWTMYDGLNSFIEEMMKSKDKKKRLVIQSRISKEIIECNFSEEPLTARIMDNNDNTGLTFEQLSKAYEIWKLNRNKEKP